MSTVEGGQISVRQATLLLATTIHTTVILFAPALIASIAGPDSWLVPAVPTFAALAVIGPVAALQRRHPGLTLVQIAEATLGKILGKAVTAVFLFWLIHANSVIVRELGELISTSVLMETPLEVIMGGAAFVAAILVLLGLEVLARSTEVIFFNMAVFFAIVMALGARDFRPERLLPFLENGIVPVLQASASPSAFRGEVVLLGMVMPFLEQRERTFFVGLGAVLITAVFLTAVTAGAVMMFGPEETGRLISPTLELARTVQAGGFVERIEALVVATWIAGMLIKMAVFLYAAVLGLAQWAGLRDYRPITAPVAAATVVVGIGSFSSFLEVFGFIRDYWAPYGLTVEIGFPLLLLAASLARGTWSREKQPAAGGGAG